jgi:hypothetical protein
MKSNLPKDVSSSAAKITKLSEIGKPLEKLPF